MLNTSVVHDDATARTNPDAAQQRAENLAAFGCSTVLELCVGPSLEVLENFYAQQGIKVVGNDIDHRWKAYYPKGKWIIGDALNMVYSGFDAVVFAPPLSKGCTGKREDSLMIDQVFPKYTSFLDQADDASVKVYTMVCPARCIATSRDRSQLFNLLNHISIKGFKFDVIELKSKKRDIVKYVDLYFYR